jgi:hypothetical protein
MDMMVTVESPRKKKMVSMFSWMDERTRKNGFTATSWRKSRARSFTRQLFFSSDG